MVTPGETQRHRGCKRGMALGSHPCDEVEGRAVGREWGQSGSARFGAGGHELRGQTCELDGPWRHPGDESVCFPGTEDGNAQTKRRLLLTAAPSPPAPDHSGDSGKAAFGFLEHFPQHCGHAFSFLCDLATLFCG